MKRYSPSRSGAGGIFNLLQDSQAKLKLSIKRKLEGSPKLPLYNQRTGNTMMENSGSQMYEKLIHLVPVIVLLCILILWWFSYPVILEIKNGRIMAIHRIDMPSNLNETRVDLAILALTLPPHPSVHLMHKVNNFDNAPEPANIITD